MINSNNQHNNNNHHNHQHNQMLSLSTNNDEYNSSSRYSSLQDNSSNSESIKSAILDSFRMHWIQAWSIMEYKILYDITNDDLSSIVNHLEQMISLLIEENLNDIRTTTTTSTSINCDIKIEHTSTTTTSSSSENNQQQHNNFNESSSHTSSTTSTSLSTSSPLLEFLSNELILEKIYQWSEMSGEWKNIMYLEQLKLYELLISQLCQNDIILLLKSSSSTSSSPLIQPLLYLLNSLSKFLSTNYDTILNNNNNNYIIEIEKRLVLLLNTLSVIISQNNCLLNLFIQNNNIDNNNKITINNNDNDNNNNNNNNIMPKKQQKQEQNESSHYSNNNQKPSLNNCDNNNNYSFPLFTLLIQYLHRDNSIGQQSRDAILLCLSMTKFNEQLAYYIANKTDFCPILATGLSGHFSSLPRVLISADNNNTIINNNNEQYQSSFYHHTKEIDHFLKCLDFCNAVVQISHPIIQVQLLKYTYNGFLLSVIGPALHQNTLDEIITTTAYLDLFIRTTNEPKLIRIFLEFLCFEIYDNQYIITTLINRINAKSKLSLVTIIFFKTLLDLNCEDLLYELIFKHLLRGKHLRQESSSQNDNNNKSYKKNWLIISAQKLLSTSLSHYLYNTNNNKCCLHQNNNDNIISNNNNNNKCKCHLNYFNIYLDYLNDAKINIEQCENATKIWRNNYNKICHLLNNVQDENIIFCTIEKNNNDENYNDTKIINDNDDDDYVIDINDIIKQNTLLAKFSTGFKMKNCYYDYKLKKINYKIENNMINGGGDNNNNIDDDNYDDEKSPIGSFLTILFIKFENFFNNDVITNLHLTGLLTRLCHFQYKLLLSLLFDETLLRTKNVQCFLHIIQRLSIEAQNYCDEIPDFELVFQAAKSNLQSMPLGDVDCSLLLTTNLHTSTTSLLSSISSSSSTTTTTSKINESNDTTGSQNKAFGLLKNFFLRATNSSSSSTSTTINRRPSNASIASSTGQTEVVPGGVRFINQTLLQKQRELREQKDQARNVNRFNQLVYNLIIFDEFLMELSAILIHHSLRDIEN